VVLYKLTIDDVRSINNSIPTKFDADLDFSLHNFTLQLAAALM